MVKWTVAIRTAMPRTISVPREALVSYVVGAYLSPLEWWLTTDPSNPPEEIDRTFRTLVTPGIRAAMRSHT